MNRSDLVQMTVEKALALNPDTDVESVQTTISILFDPDGTIVDCLKGTDDGKLTISKFGSFILRTRSARTGRNPKTGEPVNIPAKRRLYFAASSILREKLER